MLYESLVDEINELNDRIKELSDMNEMKDKEIARLDGQIERLINSMKKEGTAYDSN